uniref:Bifunctional protein PyrR n=1 Tax=candidate division WOR-3 bacterium TaxID=2052148 RepID=A0A7C4UHA5_UNCW3
MKKKILDKQELGKIIEEISENLFSYFNGKFEEICVIGIKNRGDIIAKRIIEKLEKKGKFKILFGAIDITLYRDDLSSIGPKPLVGTTEIDFQIDGKTVLLVDDVLFTGRTIRAAIDEIIDFGRPKRIFLLVLIDRGGRELPICPDFVGKRIDCEEGENVAVCIDEIDGEEGVYILNNRKDL